MISDEEIELIVSRSLYDWDNHDRGYALDIVESDECIGFGIDKTWTDSTWINFLSTTSFYNDASWHDFHFTLKSNHFLSESSSDIYPMDHPVIKKLILRWKMEML